MNNFYTKNLSIDYNQISIIENLNIDIPINKITVIIGSNGCGKSTLLKALTRVICDYKGAIILDDIEILKEKTKDLAKKISFLPQSPDSNLGLTVSELMAYGRFPYQKGFGVLNESDFKIIDWALEVTGTKEFKHKRIDNLSGGQKQRIWIAMALVQETPIILLDEPTTYLDLAHQLEILELLKELNIEQKRTIIMVLHDLNQASKFADYIIALKDGKVVKSGEPINVITNEILKEVYNIDAKIEIDSDTKKPICTTYNLIKKVSKNEKTINNI